MSNSTIDARRVAAISCGVGFATQIYAARAENAEIWDADDKRYIDFGAGVAVVNTGHRHPKVVAAVKAQLDCFTHTCHQVVPYESYVHLAERLNEIVPGEFSKKTIFVTTGAEATENAVKIARAATNRSAVIAFTGGFHGRTYMSLSLTGKVAPYKVGFGPMMPDVFHVPFPVELYDISVGAALRALDDLFKSDLDPSRVAAFIIEPVQGEGGFNEAPRGFMKELRSIADQHGIVLIADEVQTGFARTGRMFAMERLGVVADLTALAKGLGGGLPIAAVTGRADLMDAPSAGGLGGTFCGNPIGIAAAHAVLDVIAEERLCERAEALGSRLKQHLQSLVDVVPQIAEIRGPGLMVAVEFNKPGKKAPHPEFSNKVRQRALQKGLIVLPCGLYNNCLRFSAPLTVGDDVFSEGLDIIDESLRECASEELAVS
jgi:4-aminobutyrate aminotransferase